MFQFKVHICITWKRIQFIISLILCIQIPLFIEWRLGNLDGFWHIIILLFTGKVWKNTWKIRMNKIYNPKCRHKATVAEKALFDASPGQHLLCLFYRLSGSVFFILTATYLTGPFCWRLTGAWASNCNSGFTCPCPNFKGGRNKPMLESRHG